MHRRKRSRLTALGLAIIALAAVDDDILAAAAAGLGTLDVTTVLVRCPVVNFANLR